MSPVFHTQACAIHICLGILAEITHVPQGRIYVIVQQSSTKAKQ